MAITATKKDGLIVGRYTMHTLQLAELNVDHGLTVEEMVSKYSGNNPNINSANYPNCHAGKTGTESAEILLVNPVTTLHAISTCSVLNKVDEGGFTQEISRTWPLLNTTQMSCGMLVSSV